MQSPAKTRIDGINHAASTSPPLLSPHRQKQHRKGSAPSPHMDSSLSRASSSRPLASTIGIVDETPPLPGQVGSFNAGPLFTSFRAIDNVGTQQPLQNATQAQGSIALQGNVPHGPNDGIPLLQPPEQSFQQPGFDGVGGDAASTSFAGQLQGMKLVPNPPDLEYWRDRLFNVDEVITMSEEQYVISARRDRRHSSRLTASISLLYRFQTYFPHVDNVYSHRSTQRYKRRPFVSHYWDCRLKGRPPGTPKSDDPNKKKRKRTARERDLCDVKIKITEYFPGAGIVDTSGGFETLPAELLPGVHTLFPVQGSQPFGVLAPGSNLPDGHPGANGERYFTIQRVNGNGANGKNEGVGGGHRHTLEDSDRVKKNSVQRHILKEEKERKRAAVCLVSSCVVGCFCYLSESTQSRLGGSPQKPSWLRHSQHHFDLSLSASLIPTKDLLNWIPLLKDRPNSLTVSSHGRRNTKVIPHESDGLGRGHRSQPFR